MRILFDLISIQGFYNGGAEYTIKVLKTLMARNDIEIVGLFDSRLAFMPEDVGLPGSVHKCVDIRSFGRVADVIAQERIDCFFIGIAQRYMEIDLAGVACRTIVVMHDVGDLGRIDNLYESRCSSVPGKSTWSRAWRRVCCLWRGQDRKPDLQRVPVDYKGAFRTDAPGLRHNLMRYDALAAFCALDHVTLVTVSQFSAQSIRYYLEPLRRKKIEVLWAPAKVVEQSSGTVENPEARRLIESGIPYFLCVSASHWFKNVRSAAEVFCNFSPDHPEFRLLTLGSGEAPLCEKQICLPYVSRSDLEQLYRHCYAFVFPSLFEGFGYPPVEALRAGVPVLCSNATSMPEVMRDDAVWFSPYERSSLFAAMTYLVENYAREKTKALEGGGSRRIAARQEADLEKLIALFNLS